jgi:hypothetical protein
VHPHTIPHSVDGRWLLALYLIIPLSLLVVLADLLLLGRHWQQQWLPDDPNDWAVWALLFGLPHIVASALTVAKPAYIGHFWRRLLPALLVFCAISLLGLLGPQPLSYQVLFVFFAAFTVYHVLSQQLGIGLVLAGLRPDALFLRWKWTAIVSGLAIYLNVYGQQFLGRVQIAGVDLYQLLGVAGALLCAALMLLTWQLARLTEGRLGRAYLWANALLLLSALLIDRLGYTLFVILMPRLIHDLTAYSVYITHDRNRNQGGEPGWLYRWLPRGRWVPLLWLPLCSVAIAWPLNNLQHYWPVAAVVFVVSFMHYYYEGFVWRGDSPLRRHVRFSR